MTRLTHVQLILVNVVYAVIGRFTNGEIPVTDILPTLERAVFRLTADNASEAGMRSHVRPASDDRHDPPEHR